MNIMDKVQPATMTQVAPYPDALVEMVEQLTYKPGWSFWIGSMDRGQGSDGMTLIISTVTPDSYHPEQTMRVNHYFPVPPASYDMRSWRHWLLEQFLLVERHEACEFFQLGGERPYAPSHGFGQDPYLIREIGTETDVKTSYLNEENP